MLLVSGDAYCYGTTSQEHAEVQMNNFLDSKPAIIHKLSFTVLQGFIR